MPEPITFPPGTPIRLSDIDLSIQDPEYDKPSAGKRIRKNAARMATLANIMYAENRHSILLVLQGMDTAGKDGTIRTVMQGVNPRSCQVVSFKRPTEEELDHDFLWRVHRNVPGRGNIGIFNRSHYEDVLAVRVHQLVPEPVWRLRYDHINDFEKLLYDAGTRLVKCFLMITKETQRPPAGADRRPGGSLEVQPGRSGGAATLGGLRRSLRRDAHPLQHGLRAVVHHPVRKKVVSEPDRERVDAADDRIAGSQVPATNRRLFGAGRRVRRRFVVAPSASSRDPR